jgi:hypothetical protein
MKRIQEQLLVFAGAFIFFLVTLAENFSGPHDSITYLTGIVDGYPLVNQHHLLYHYAAYCWLQFWQLIFPGVKDYYIIESFSSLWGSLSLVVLYSFFRYRFYFTGVQAAFSILPIAFSYGFWFYSVNIEVYAPPLFFILLALYYLTRPVLSNLDWFRVFLLHCLAIVFHQVNALFLPVVLWKLWEQRGQLSFIRGFIAYAIMGVALVGGAYFIVGWIVEEQNSFSKWIQWMRGYSSGSVFWYPLSAKTPIDVSYGFAHAMLGGHYVFQIPTVKEIINSSLASHSLGDEIYIARNIDPGMAVSLTILTAVLGFVMIWLFVRMAGNFRSLRARSGSVITPLILTFFIYSAFFTFWMPEILEFWILQTVIVWLLLLGAIPAKQLSPGLTIPRIAAFLAIMLFCINYFGSIRWMQSKENDFYYVKAKTVEKTASTNDLVLMQDGWIVKDFLAYFTKVKAQPVPQKDSSWTKTDSLFNAARSRRARIYILPEIRNKLQAPGTEYLDSIRRVYPEQLRRIRERDPEIWVIE